MRRLSVFTAVLVSVVGAISSGCGSGKQNDAEASEDIDGGVGGSAADRETADDTGASSAGRSTTNGGSGGSASASNAGKGDGDSDDGDSDDGTSDDGTSDDGTSDGGSTGENSTSMTPEGGAGADGEPSGTGGSGTIGGVDAAGTTGSPGAGGEGAESYSYDCGAFDEDAGWTVRNGYRAVIVADQDDGLNQPVAATFAEGAFGGLLYVVNQGDNVLRSVDVATGAVEVVIDTGSWDLQPRLLTTIVWDEHQVFDGSLYVGDQGSNADNNSRVYRVNPERTVTTFVEGGYGLDDVYGLAFPPPGSAYEPGLYVTGDTDNGARPDWGLVAADGSITAFSEVTGAEGIAFDVTGRYEGALWASRPNGGGYAGDDSITPIGRDGLAGPAIATGLRGIHAVTFSRGGDLGANMYAASWSTGQLLQVDPQGQVTELASGLRLTNYDGNILAVSSDGNVLFVADRLAHQLVCIEAI